MRTGGRGYRLAGRRIFPEWVRLLEQRADFRTYFEEAANSAPLLRARQLAQLELVANIEARREALAEALRAGDIKAIEALNSLGDRTGSSTYPFPS